MKKILSFLTSFVMVFALMTGLIITDIIVSGTGNEFCGVYYKP